MNEGMMSRFPMVLISVAEEMMFGSSMALSWSVGVAKSDLHKPYGPLRALGSCIQTQSHHTAQAFHA
jgi:hypothetical protein